MNQDAIDKLIAEETNPEKKVEYEEILRQNFQCRYCKYSTVMEQDEKKILINMFLPPSVSFKTPCQSELGHALYPSAPIQKIKRKKGVK